MSFRQIKQMIDCDQTAYLSKNVFCSNNPRELILPFPIQSLVLVMKMKNMVEDKELACYKHFFCFFHNVFYPLRFLFCNKRSL